MRHPSPNLAAHDALLVQQMAERLRHCDAWRSERDAIRALVGNFRTDDIAELLDRARLACFRKGAAA